MRIRIRSTRTCIHVGIPYLYGKNFELTLLLNKYNKVNNCRHHPVAYMLFIEWIPTITMITYPSSYLEHARYILKLRLRIDKYYLIK